MEPEEQYLDVDGARLCWQSYGDSADPCLLLVGGAACAMDWWDDDLCRILADRARRVVRYDHRDTGRSSCDPPGAPTYDGGALDADCVALARHLGPSPVHLVGLSMGGGIAQTVALRHPELVATLTLASTSPVGGVDAELPGPLPAVAATFEAEPSETDWSDPGAVAERLVEAERPFAGTLGFDEERVRRTAARVAQRSAIPASAENHWLVLGSGDGDDLDVTRIQAPTLVVHGGADPLFPRAHGEALAAAIPGASLVVLDGVGHEYPPPRTWARFADVLLAHTGG
ncbi:hypothetical protein GCM10011519_14570 [Marmoricola endophyticus]|uniref:AB hydrolase-1 domain-containing protein n=1 Tax=Marmoricola endophyticus TaxID=2040280 RepID=A0A917F142_9ACTN|nr:alpha/beta hydrolase [Marmoricola endophyticus]GGF41855.1 hypothetical protein GCM10011519_14570 [Marmoricola endophyticus]